MILLCSDYDGTLHFKNENDSGYFKPEDLKEIANRENITLDEIDFK